MPHDEAWKKKISLTMKGRPISLETRQRMSLAKKGKPGKPKSLETRQRMSLAQKGKPGKPLSLETRQRISLALKGKPISPSNLQARKDKRTARLAAFLEQENRKQSRLRAMYAARRLKKVSLSPSNHAFSSTEEDVHDRPEPRPVKLA